MQATSRSSADWRIIAFDGEVIVSTWAPFYGKNSLRRLLEELLHFTSDSRFDIVSETCSKSFCIHVHSIFEDSLKNIVVREEGVGCVVQHESGRSEVCFHCYHNLCRAGYLSKKWYVAGFAGVGPPARSLFVLFFIINDAGPFSCIVPRG